MQHFAAPAMVERGPHGQYVGVQDADGRQASTAGTSAKRASTAPPTSRCRAPRLIGANHIAIGKDIGRQVSKPDLGCAGKMEA